MAEATPRSRVPQAPAQNPPAAAPAGQGYGMGDVAGARARAEADVTRQQEAAQRRASGLSNPYRFWMRIGETADLVILDASLEQVFFCNEHQMQGSSGKWDVHELCPKEWESCPLCASKESYYAMFLTVIDWRAYTNKSNVQVPHSKKLLCVKSNGMQDYFRIADAATAQHGTMRGTHIVVTREGQNSLSTGRPVMFENGQMFEVFDEATLVATFGNPQTNDQQGKLVKAENADIVPYPYAQLFPRPTGAALVAKYGGNVASGSPQANAAAWGQPAAAPQAAPVPQGAAVAPVAVPVSQDTAGAVPAAQPTATAAPLPAAPPMTTAETQVAPAEAVAQPQAARPRARSRAAEAPPF